MMLCSPGSRNTPRGGCLSYPLTQVTDVGMPGPVLLGSAAVFAVDVLTLSRREPVVHFTALPRADVLDKGGCPGSS